MRFLLVDRILALEPGRTIHAVKSLPAHEELFRDHFPGFPVVPGVLLVEMMGQAAAQCLLAGDPARGRPMLARINSASFREWVPPDQVIDLHAEVISSRPQFATIRARAEVAGKVRATAELMFCFTPQTGSPDPLADPLIAAWRNAAGKPA